MKKIKPPVKFYDYYAVPDKHHHYKGVRFFRVERGRMNEVVQVVLSSGDCGKGRGHLFGITTVSAMTFFSNYLAMQYVIPCDRKLYQKAFDGCVKFLKG